MDDLNCTQTDDARVWAKEFMQTVEDNNITIDEDFMLGWFANAIECGHTVKLERDKSAVKTTNQRRA